MQKGLIIMKNKTLQSSFILLLTSVIWGMGFVSQRFGMDLVGPFFFSGMRTLFAALTILLAIVVTSAALKKRKTRMATASAGNGSGGQLPADASAGNAVGAAATAGRAEKWKDPWIIKGGIVCGIVLFLGQGLQQVGIVYTTASKAGFLTALYIVLVPILGIFLKNHTHWNTWVSVPIAAIGLYFLSITEAFTNTPRRSAHAHRLRDVGLAYPRDRPLRAAADAAGPL